jgi:hypothetical protein
LRILPVALAWLVDRLLRRRRRGCRTRSADARGARWWAPRGHDLTVPRQSARDSYARTAGYLIPALTSLHRNSSRSVLLPRLDVLLGEKLGLAF